MCVHPSREQAQDRCGSPYAVGDGASRGLTREAPSPLTLEQAFGDLHRVQRSAFQQLIARNEERNRTTTRIAQVPTNATDQEFVTARGIVRHREIVVLNVV